MSFSDDSHVPLSEHGVAPRARPRHLPPIRLQKHARLPILIPCVEVLQACVGIKALADIALGLRSGGQIVGGLGGLAEGAVQGPFRPHTRRRCHRADRALRIVLQRGNPGQNHSSGFGLGNADGGVGVSRVLRWVCR